jgi:hypothetical protein
LLRRKPFRKQSVQFFFRPGKTRHGALFDGYQSCLDNLFKRSVAATADYGL